MATGEPPLKKTKKKSNTHNISKVNSQNAPICSSTPRNSGTMNLNEFPMVPFGDGNLIQILADPVPHTVTASQSTVQQPKEKSTTTFDFQEFMIRKTKQNSVAIKEMGQLLKRIDEKLSNRTNNENTNNCDSVFNPKDLWLPVTAEEGLSNLDMKLQDQSTFNNMIHFLKRCTGYNIAITTSKILEKLIGNGLAERYSWHGKNHKKIFRQFSYIVNLILSSVHAICVETQNRCTDMDIILAAGKWFAQAKTRIQRAELRLNRNHGNAHLSQPTCSRESQGQHLQRPFSTDALQSPSPADTVQLSPTDTVQPSPDYVVQ